MRHSAVRRLDAERLWQQYQTTRGHTLSLTGTLSVEDQNIQSMPDASPTKWHLAHTTWFFETLVLLGHCPAYVPFSPSFSYLFNSYYEALGPRHARPARGQLSRPGVDEVLSYRMHVDTHLRSLLLSAPEDRLDELFGVITLGIHHEQQHQELIATDILHAFSRNPLRPAFMTGDDDLLRLPKTAGGPAEWLSVPGGPVDVGHQGSGFCFDNELPRHTTLVAAFEIADRLVTNGEFLDFVADGGYSRPEFWLSDGWSVAQREGWQAPAYWIAPTDERSPFANVCEWRCFGPWGVAALDMRAPVSHISFYEAAAFAEWSGTRLPTEFEWEAAHGLPGMRQMSDSVWQWTRSAYAPYPGFRPMAGAASEYNGKFMVGQQVLRGGSMATPPGHVRPSYRNFFPPAARWQFSGVRLARDTTR